MTRQELQPSVKIDALNKPMYCYMLWIDNGHWTLWYTRQRRQKGTNQAPARGWWNRETPLWLWLLLLKPEEAEDGLVLLSCGRPTELFPPAGALADVVLQLVWFSTKTVLLLLLLVFAPAALEAAESVGSPETDCRGSCELKGEDVLLFWWTATMLRIGPPIGDDDGGRSCNACDLNAREFVFKYKLK